ncbi:hypothetical protein NHX12_007605, partial [Muraenolepis orangiensis]
ISNLLEQPSTVRSRSPTFCNSRPQRGADLQPSSAAVHREEQTSNLLEQPSTERSRSPTFWNSRPRRGADLQPSGAAVHREEQISNLLEQSSTERSRPPTFWSSRIMCNERSAPACHSWEEPPLGVQAPPLATKECGVVSGDTLYKV